jgi:hypothetical protein
MLVIDKTRYDIFKDAQYVRVEFDLNGEENCQIGLDFTKSDVLNIINMKTLKKTKIDVEGISGNAVLQSGFGEMQKIAFTYKNGSSGYGTVPYPYARLVRMLNGAFSELNRR